MARTPSLPPASAAAEEGSAHRETRAALLDAAERLISVKGVEGTSVRDIVREASANLGAINYHFGTKERLVLEVFARRMEPVNQERVARLDALEAEAKGGKLSLPDLLEALIRPGVESEGQSGTACDDMMRVISRSFQEANPELKKFVEQQFQEVADRFDRAIARAVPGLPPEELFWRTHFLFGALHHGQEIWVRWGQFPRPASGAPSERPEREDLIQFLIAFAAAGLSGPATSRQGIAPEKTKMKKTKPARMAPPKTK